MRVLETVLYAEDLGAARAFYEGVLGLPVITFEPDRHLFLRCEQSVVIIFKASKTIVPDAGVPPHGAVGPGHIAFAATREELAEWDAALAKASVAVIERVAWPNGAESIYFRDPSGNVLEFATPDLWGFG